MSSELHSTFKSHTPGRGAMIVCWEIIGSCEQASARVGSDVGGTVQLKLAGEL